MADIDDLDVPIGARSLAVDDVDFFLGDGGGRGGFRLRTLGQSHGGNQNDGDGGRTNYQRISILPRKRPTDYSPSRGRRSDLPVPLGNCAVLVRSGNRADARGASPLGMPVMRRDARAIDARPVVSASECALTRESSACPVRFGMGVNDDQCRSGLAERHSAKPGRSHRRTPHAR